MADEVTLWTYQDAVEHVLDLFQMDRNTRNTRQARRSVNEAYRELMSMWRWKYTMRRFSITTSASYSTGTVVYDHTGGSSERLLTFTGSTLPDDFAYGRIIINDNHYRVAERLSGTTGTLSVNSNPGADVASTSFTWYRDAYPLPVGVRKLSQPFESGDVGTYLDWVGLQELMDTNRGYVTVSDPYYYTVARDMNYTGQLAVLFGPPPSSSSTYEFWGQFGGGKPLMTEKYSTGTLSTVGTAVTGSGTAWTQRMVGSVLRIGTTSAVPTGPFGDVDNVDNPFVEQRIITAVGTATSLTIDQALTDDAGAGTKYTISDLVDVEENSMWGALLRLAEARMSVLTSRPTSEQRLREQRATEAIRMAIAADNRTFAEIPVGLGDAVRLRDLASEVDMS